MAGPIALLMLKLVLLIAMALSRSSFGTNIGVIRSQAGAAIAPPAPSTKVVIRSVQGSAILKLTTKAKTTDTTATNACDPISSRRASKISASTPAGSVSRNIGSMVATCTADTIIGSGFRLVISQLIDVSNMAMPMFESELAIRMTENAACANTVGRDDGGSADSSGFALASIDNGDFRMGRPPHRMGSARPRDA